MRLKLAAVFAVTVGCLAVVLWDLDLAHARAALAATNWIFIFPMFVLYLLAHAIRTFRLGILLGTPIPFSSLFSVNSIGFLAINVVPLRLGEMVRPYLLSSMHGVAFGRALAAIVLERLLDILMLLGMLVGLTWMVDLPQEGLVVRGIDVVGTGQRLAGGIVAVGVLMGCVLVVVGEPAIAFVGRLPGVGRFTPFVRRLREGFVELARNPARSALLLLISASIWVVTLFGVQVVMAFFPGVPATFPAAWTTWSVTLSGMTALPTPGFFGGYELFCTAALWLWDVDGDVARTFAIVLHLGQFSFTVGLGSLFLMREGLSLRQLVSARPSD